MLDKGASWLNDQRDQWLSSPIEYICSDGAKIQCHATIGRTVFRATNEYGVTVRTEAWDFLISASELEHDPKRGDRIIRDGFEYEVLAPNNEPVWRWSGTGRTTRRIHTKYIGEISDA
jgi:hypothetical protein